MAVKEAVILCGVFLLLCCIGQTESFISGQTTSASCSSDKISCRSGNQCIYLYDICKGGQHCTDGSDEDPKICSFWPTENRCSRGQFYCSGCRTIKDFCGISSCVSQKDSRICEMVNSGKLQLESEETGMALTEELVKLMAESVNMTKSATPCPMFYTRVGEGCLSFFSPAKVPWPEARQFCLSIGGDLASVGKQIQQEKLVQYMGMSKLTSSYWIGGRYDVDTNSWSWVHDDSSMALGSPFWATRYSSSCVPRSPPHTDPFSGPSAALPGAPCYNYVQAPVKRSAGWCAAITYEHYYYFTDEVCQDTKSPLCFYTGGEKNTLN